MFDAKKVGSRLREERERIRASQVDFALIAAQHGITGATQRSITRYENGVQTPSIPFLLAVSYVGVDINYVLSGVRKIHISEEKLEEVLREAISPTDPKFPPSVNDLLLMAKKLSRPKLTGLVYEETEYGDIPFVLGGQITPEQIVSIKGGVTSKRKGRPPKSTDSE